MILALRQLFSRPQESAPAQVPEAERVYAIGDIHGRSDLFEALIEAVEADDAERGPAETTVILLGDLVDRGPDSVGVVQLAWDWQKRRKVRILAGNHEEMFLRSFHDTEMLRHFLRHGGRETLWSYGIDRRELKLATLEETQKLMDAAVPGRDRVFMDNFEDMITIGDYLFVHAGINPDVPLEDQKRQDLRWIREPFLSHSKAYGPVVVHGHSISEAPDERTNRIGIDTGAYASGVLTALVLEGGNREFLSAIQGEDGEIRVTAGPQAA
jgi:serine/threonine protein phosphatase 1